MGDDKFAERLRQLHLESLPGFMNLPFSLTNPHGSFLSHSDKKSFFSVGEGVGDRIGEKLGLNRLNSIIWNLRQHALLVEKGQKYMNLSLLKPEDVLKEVQQGLKQPSSMLSQRIQASLVKEGTLEAMSASSFLSLVAFDSDLSQVLSTEEKIEVGNALTFAWWKESIEYLIMLQSPSNFKEILMDPSASYQNADLTGNERLFAAFCNNEMPLQQFGMDTSKFVNNIENMLRISPWCGAVVVLSRMKKENKLWRVENRILRDRLREIAKESGPTFQANCQYLLSREAKRWLEHQFVLGLSAAYLKGKAAESQLYEKCNALKEYSQIIDTKKTFGAYQGTAARLFKELKANKQLRKEVSAFVQKEMVTDEMSSALADVISKTVRKLVDRAWHSEALLSIMAVFFVYQGGLFSMVKRAAVSFAGQTVQSAIRF